MLRKWTGFGGEVSGARALVRSIRVASVRTSAHVRFMLNVIAILAAMVVGAMIARAQNAYTHSGEHTETR